MIIYKYHLARINGCSISIDIPASANVLHVGLDPDDKPCMWVILDPEQLTNERTFMTVWTGFNLLVDHVDYLGSVKEGTLMHHIFEVTE